MAGTVDYYPVVVSFEVAQTEVPGKADIIFRERTALAGIPVTITWSYRVDLDGTVDMASGPFQAAREDAWVERGYILPT